ncbi:MAG: hypothetical protein WBP58_01870 [Chitinophagaceae bacterium]
MKIELKFSAKNHYPFGAVFLPGNLVTNWLNELDFMGFDASDIETYAVPGLRAAEISGCVVIVHNDIGKKDVRSNMFCQCAGKYLFIPANTMLYPAVTDGEIEALCKRKLHFLHPEYGLIELSEPIHWASLIRKPEFLQITTDTPKQGTRFPYELRSIRLMPSDPVEALANFEKENFPAREPLPNKPLNLIEKIKLYLYKLLFRSGSDGDWKKPSWITKIPFLFKILERTNALMNRMQADYSALEKRNEKTVDQLVRLLKDNPELGLKYALPLDESGMGRGKGNWFGEFILARRWTDFSLFGMDKSEGGGIAAFSDESFFKLQKQYRDTADELIKSGKYKNAAFIYLKLLKDNFQAAVCLEKGGFYAEAAALFLKKINDPSRAAECYAKGGMPDQAIEIYKKQKQFEKVGDLYASIKKTDLANQYYQLVVDDHLTSRQFLKAAIIYRVKMNDTSAAKDICLKAWKDKEEMDKCMKFYFNCFADAEEQAAAIEKIYQTEVNPDNRIIFLNTIKEEYQKNKENRMLLKQIGYEIISASADTHPDIVSVLAEFDRKDQQLLKDTFRFKQSKKGLK